MVGVESVLLLYRHPRQRAAPARQLVAHARLLLLTLEQLLALGVPLATADNFVNRHRRLVSSPRWVTCDRHDLSSSSSVFSDARPVGRPTDIDQLDTQESPHGRT